MCQLRETHPSFLQRREPPAVVPDLRLLPTGRRTLFDTPPHFKIVETRRIREIDKCQKLLRPRGLSSFGEPRGEGQSFFRREISGYRPTHFASGAHIVRIENSLEGFVGPAGSRQDPRVR